LADLETYTKRKIEFEKIIHPIFGKLYGSKGKKSSSSDDDDESNNNSTREEL
jgi:hypothetical protein